MHARAKKGEMLEEEHRIFDIDDNHECLILPGRHRHKTFLVPMMASGKSRNFQLFGSV